VPRPPITIPVATLLCLLCSCAHQNAPQDAPAPRASPQTEHPATTQSAPTAQHKPALQSGPASPQQVTTVPPPPQSSSTTTASSPPIQPAVPPPTDTPASTPLVAAKELFPGVLVDLTAKTVEFDGIVPINAHDPAAPTVYLEVFACLPDTKEHESVVMTSVRPSHVHAALLLIGLKPGKPGGWDLVDDKLVPIEPSGDAVLVRVSYKDAAGNEVVLTPDDLIVDAATGAPFSKKDGGRWLFTGSRIVQRQGREWYDADGAGILIGLTTFGGETVAWSHTISPDSELHAPEWIASPRTPPAGTPVKVTLSPLPR